MLRTGETAVPVLPKGLQESDISCVTTVPEQLLNDDENAILSAVRLQSQTERCEFVIPIVFAWN